MKFHIEHVIAGTDQAGYETLYFDETFQMALCQAVKLERTLLALERGPTRIVRRVRAAPERELPGPVAKLLGGKRLAYMEELEYDVGQYRGRWRSVPEVLTDKITIGGTLEFQAVPSDSGAGRKAVKRVFAGEIKVAVFGLGGLVERSVVSNLEKSYADAASFTAKWLARPSA